MEKFKAVGYVKKHVYNGNIEYRNFTPDLVGLQLTSDGGTPLFTMGNFSITTNMEAKNTKIFNVDKFSDFYSLSTLDVTEEQTKMLLANNTGTYLNLDKTKLKYYALFGSLTEFIRVNLEEVITKWPASLYVTSLNTNTLGLVENLDTMGDYLYDNITDTSTFLVNTNLITNKFIINYLKSGSIVETFSETNDLRNLVSNYRSYVILVNGVEFPIIGFVGSNNVSSDFLSLTVKGDVLKDKSTKISYHIKPNKLIEGLFYNDLSEFNGYLLNRYSFPKYKSYFNTPKRTDSGLVIYSNESLTWPVTDGYNIDYDSTEYISFASKLFNIAENSDSINSNLMTRFLVSESISAFDTVPVHLAEEHIDTSGQKVNKTLQIYGVSFDEINKFITGISFANTVTYNKLDNTPDKYLKTLAKVLGWELVAPVLDNNLLTNYIATSDKQYGGESVGLSPVDADIELWRRIILNTPWIWKSKGTRKTIEFLLKFIGAPQGLIEFNEYVYVVDKPLDLEIFSKVLELNGLDTELSFYPIDSEGFPFFSSNTPDLYFQNKGLWYRETGGSGSTIDISSGNNPHSGPYDGGSTYINQLKNLIPNFSAVTISGETSSTETTNLFLNYSMGEITGYSGETFVNVVNVDGSELTDCTEVIIEIVSDPISEENLDLCGCPTGLSDDALSICIKATLRLVEPTLLCDNLVSPPTNNTDTDMYVFEKYQYNSDGSIFMVNGAVVPFVTNFIDRACCEFLGGLPTLVEYYNQVTDERINGYICCTGPNCNVQVDCKCGWLLSDKINTYNDFLVFVDNSGIETILVPNNSFCPLLWSNAEVDVTEPSTGFTGIACRITIPSDGFTENIALLRIEYERRSSLPDCCDFTFQPPQVTGCQCGWLLSDEINIGSEFLIFITDIVDNSGFRIETILVPNNSFCPPLWSVAESGVTDPTTGVIGIGCRIIIPSDGFTENIDLLRTEYEIRRRSTDCCDFTFQPPQPVEPSCLCYTLTPTEGQDEPLISGRIFTFTRCGEDVAEVMAIEFGQSINVCLSSPVISVNGGAEIGLSINNCCIVIPDPEIGCVVQPNAGTNGTLTVGVVCVGTTPTNADLFAALLGTPASGGTWSNVGLVYTYTVTGVAPCVNATATVTVTEQAQPVEPTTACYETAIFNNTTCAWEVTGTQPVEPTTALDSWETRSFNDTTCAWEVTGTQPVEPNCVCYDLTSIPIADPTQTQPFGTRFTVYRCGQDVAESIFVLLDETVCVSARPQGVAIALDERNGNGTIDEPNGNGTIEVNTNNCCTETEPPPRGCEGPNGDFDISHCLE